MNPGKALLGSVSGPTAVALVPLSTDLLRASAGPSSGGYTSSVPAASLSRRGDGVLTRRSVKIRTVRLLSYSAASSSR